MSHATSNQPEPASKRSPIEHVAVGGVLMTVDGLVVLRQLYVKRLEIALSPGIS